MNRKIYREIAKKHGISAGEVKKEMQAAIDQAYINPNRRAAEVPRKNAVPTVDEFVDYSVKQIKDDDNE